jgi:TPR repeat protein
MLIAALGGASIAAPVDEGLSAARAGDYATAFRLLTPLAESGDADAEFWLGVLHENGQGVAKDGAQAAQWYRLAADKGLLAAQNNLGGLYAAGNGVPHDHAAAFKWWSLAAERGFGRSQLNLAGLYFEGEGVPQDYVEAYKWARLAEVLGEAQAPRLLDQIKGRMSPADIAEGERLAREWQPVSGNRI